MEILECVENAIYLYLLFLFIVCCVLIYKVVSWYYSYQYRQILLLKKNRYLYLFFCWLEELSIISYVIPTSIGIAVVTGVGGSVDYLALTNNYRDLLIALLTVISITTAIVLICISFEKNIKNKIYCNQELPLDSDKAIIRSMVHKIKIFSSGYKHLWLSIFLIVYTLWLLFALTSDSLEYPEFHYSLLWKLYFVSGISFVKTLIEFSILSREI